LTEADDAPRYAEKADSEMIQVEHLTKEFKRRVTRGGFLASLRDLLSPEYSVVRAVDNISFRIDEGELVGYIGPDGAGKSTSIKMLTGILVPTSGHVEVNGIVPHKDRKANARQIGVVLGQRTQLWWDVPAIESLRLLRDIYKVPEPQFRRNLSLFRDLLDLHEFEQVPVRQLSLGQRMRADIAAASGAPPGSDARRGSPPPPSAAFRGLWYTPWRRTSRFQPARMVVTHQGITAPCGVTVSRKRCDVAAAPWYAALSLASQLWVPKGTDSTLCTQVLQCN